MKYAERCMKKWLLMSETEDFLKFPGTLSGEYKGKAL
jgi:hypothetical protein